MSNSHIVATVTPHQARQVAREQWLRNPPDYPLKLLDACHERLARIRDERPEEDRNWTLLAALDFARFLKRRALGAA